MPRLQSTEVSEMVSVTQRIAQIKQPYRGYLPPSAFKVTQLNDGKILGEENIPGGTIGMVVDYLSRWQLFGNKEEAFHISMIGAKRVGREKEAIPLLEGIRDMSDSSITNACRLVYFDTFTRGGPEPLEPFTAICPDASTCENIRIMVDRAAHFFEEYGPVTEDGFHMVGGYTDIVDRGDGDFLTKDTVWDFKVLRKEPQTKNTLQILMYFLMGKRSIDPFFKDVHKLGFFNPRMNKVYLYDTNDLDPETVKAVERDVIGYTD